MSEKNSTFAFRMVSEVRNINNRQRLTLRLGSGALAVSLVTPNADDDSAIEYETYVMKSGVSEAANLRMAIKVGDLLSRKMRKIRVMVPSGVLMVPINLFDHESKDMLYRHSFPHTTDCMVESMVVPYLNCVALFAVNKDTNTVLTDNFEDVKYMPAASPVWRYLHRRSEVGYNHKLYAYFADEKLTILSFSKNRFRFYNVFQIEGEQDAMYFTLYVWQLLGYNQEKDELHIVSDRRDMGAFADKAREFVKNVYLVNAAADYNTSLFKDYRQMPYDMLLLAQDR